VSGHKPWAEITRKRDSRILIGLDVDGTLYRWGRAVRKAVRRRFGVTVSNDYWFGEEHVTPEIWEWVWSPVGVREVFGTGESFPGAIQAAKDLCRIGRVRILTAIPPEAQKVRKAWLDARRIPYDELVFVGLPPTTTGASGTDGKAHASKSEYLPHCDVYIDDSPNNCDELVQNTKARVILLDHSWNRKRNLEPKSRSKRLVRAHDWGEVLELTEQVARTRVWSWSSS